MFHKQMGCLQIIVFIGGLIWAIFFILVFLNIFVHALAISETINWSALTWEHAFRIVITIFGFSLFSFFGIILMELFPAVRVDETGLYVKRIFAVDHFSWDEVKEVTNAKSNKNAKAVILSPSGNRITNFIKYYAYFMHGQIAGITLEPVVILTEGLRERDEILKGIGRHIRSRIYSQTALPLKD